MEDKEASFAELVARVDVAIAYVKSLSAAKFEGAEGREIKRKIRGVERTFTGIDYLFQVRASQLLLPPDRGVRDPAA